MKKRYGSIQPFILIPVLILGIFSVFSSMTGIKNIENVNSDASEIADNYLISISKLGDMQLTTQSLHELALSHIIATDFDTMVGIVDKIHETQAQLDEQLNGYTEYLSDENKADYELLCENIDNLNYYISDIMAFSALGDKVSAYACANGEIATYGNAIKECISRMTNETTNQAERMRNSLSDVYDEAISTSHLIITVSILILIAVFIIVTLVVIRPLAVAKKEITSIIKSIDQRNGDLTKRIKVRSFGEIAALSDGINLFMDKLQNIFRVISDNSNKMNMVVNKVNESVSASNNSATNVSAITEEISSTMSDMSENVSHVNANTSDVEKEVNLITDKTYEINQYSKQMKEQADEMASSARENMELTSKKVNDILRELRQSIDDSESIEQISSLTREILEISKHTNILAINAKIEATKAGKAGKSFAVVAAEVGQLANSTRQSANTIQKVNEVVTKAVSKLAENANELVTYMTEDILPEFEMFVKSGEQYKRNASYIETTMDEFSVKISNLKENMTMIAQSMDSIANSIKESTIGINSTAENTQTLVQDMNRISLRMNDNMKIVSLMKSETEVFTKL